MMASKQELETRLNMLEGSFYEYYERHKHPTETYVYRAPDGEYIKLSQTKMFDLILDHLNLELQHKPESVTLVKKKEK